MSIDYINTIATGEKQYPIQSVNTLDSDRIIGAACSEIRTKDMPQLAANLKKVSDNLVVSEYLSENTKEAFFSIGNNHASLKDLQSQIKGANGEINRCFEDLKEVEKALEDINIPTIDECPTMSLEELEIESNIYSIELTIPQKIPNRMYGKQSIYKINCKILVNDKLFNNDIKEKYKDGIEIAIPLPIEENQAFLPLQLGGIWQSTNSNNKAQSFDPFPMITRKGELMAICFQQSNQLIIKVFQSGMTYPCNRLFFSLEYILVNENIIEGDETTQ